MKLFRLALTLGGLALLAGGLSACLREPSYSTTPEISFDNIRVGRSYPKDSKGNIDLKGIPTDTIVVTVRYQDGDGDLGLNQAEVKLPQYTYPLSLNYYVQPLLKNPATRKYAPLTLAGQTAPFTDNGTFDHPTTLTDSKTLPIKGTLTRKLFYNYGDVFIAGQTVKFQVSILDRAMHKSNVILTDSIVIAPR